MCLSQLGQQVSLLNAIQLLEIALLLDCEILCWTTLTFIMLNVDRFLQTNLLHSFCVEKESDAIMGDVQKILVCDFFTNAQFPEIPQNIFILFYVSPHSRLHFRYLIYLIFILLWKAKLYAPHH